MTSFFSATGGASASPGTGRCHSLGDLGDSCNRARAGPAPYATHDSRHTAPLVTSNTNTRHSRGAHLALAQPFASSRHQTQASQPLIHRTPHSPKTPTRPNPLSPAQGPASTNPSRGGAEHRLSTAVHAHHYIHRRSYASGTLKCCAEAHSVRIVAGVAPKPSVVPTPRRVLTTGHRKKR